MAAFELPVRSRSAAMASATRAAQQRAVLARCSPRPCRRREPLSTTAESAVPTDARAPKGRANNISRKFAHTSMAHVASACARATGLPTRHRQREIQLQHTECTAKHANSVRQRDTTPQFKTYTTFNRRFDGQNAAGARGCTAVHPLVGDHFWRAARFVGRDPCHPRRTARAPRGRAVPRRQP